MKLLLQWYKQLLSYDTANTVKIGNLFALTWSIFAGPVINNDYIHGITFVVPPGYRYLEYQPVVLCGWQE